LQLEGLPNGAADGSMLWDPTEVLRTENDGLQNIVSILTPLPAQFGVTPGDLLHVGKFLYMMFQTGLIAIHSSLQAYSVLYEYL
jgi:hypothetical protein